MLSPRSAPKTPLSSRPSSIHVLSYDAERHPQEWLWLHAHGAEGLEPEVSSKVRRILSIGFRAGSAAVFSDLRLSSLQSPRGFRITVARPENPTTRNYQAYAVVSSPGFSEASLKSLVLLTEMVLIQNLTSSSIESRSATHLTSLFTSATRYLHLLAGKASVPVYTPIDTQWRTYATRCASATAAVAAFIVTVKPSTPSSDSEQQQLLSFCTGFEKLDATERAILQAQVESCSNNDDGVTSGVTLPLSFPDVCKTIWHGD